MNVLYMFEEETSIQNLSDDFHFLTGFMMGMRKKH